MTARRRSQGEGTIRSRVLADGSTVHDVRMRIAGKQRSFTGDTADEAWQRAWEAKLDAERGYTAPDKSLTVAAFFTDWLESTHRPAVRSRTYEATRGHVQNHIVPRLGHVRLVDLTPGHVERMLSELVAAGLTDNTARHVRGTMTNALRVAMRDHGLLRNVASLARPPKTDAPPFEPEVVSPADARRILDAVRGHRHESLVLFAIATGIRQGEQLALRWEDIDLDRRVMHVRHGIDTVDGEPRLVRLKSARSRRSVPISGLAIEALEMRKREAAADRLRAGAAWQDTGVVFANPTGGIRSGPAVSHRFRYYMIEAGMTPIRWHALRRIFAALLQDQGVALVHVRDLLGHSDLRVTEHYAYTMPDSLVRVVERIDEGLRAPEEHSGPVAGER